MPSFVIDHMPDSLFERIQDLARTRHQTPADAALEVLTGAFLIRTPPLATGPMPPPPVLSEEILEPISLPWPSGAAIRAERIVAALPAVRDLPAEE